MFLLWIRIGTLLNQSCLVNLISWLGAKKKQAWLSHRYRFQLQVESSTSHQMTSFSQWSLFCVWSTDSQQLRWNSQSFRHAEDSSWRKTICMNLKLDQVYRSFLEIPSERTSLLQSYFFRRLKDSSSTHPGKIYFWTTDPLERVHRTKRSGLLSLGLIRNAPSPAPIKIFSDSNVPSLTKYQGWMIPFLSLFKVLSESNLLIKQILCHALNEFVNWSEFLDERVQRVTSYNLFLITSYEWVWNLHWHLLRQSFTKVSRNIGIGSPCAWIKSSSTTINWLTVTFYRNGQCLWFTKKVHLVLGNESRRKLLSLLTYHSEIFSSKYLVSRLHLTHWFPLPTRSN